MFSKKNQVVKQLDALGKNLDTCKSLSDLHAVINSIIDLTLKYMPNSISKIEGLRQLTNYYPSIAKSGYTQPDESTRLATTRTKAHRYLTEITQYLENNGVEKPESKSFLETNKILLPILITLIIVGLPAVFWWGWNVSKSNTEAARQREIDLLQNKVELMGRKINELRDSIRLISNSK